MGSRDWRAGFSLMFTCGQQQRTTAMRPTAKILRGSVAIAETRGTCTRVRRAAIAFAVVAASVCAMDFAASVQAASPPCKPYVFLGARGSGEYAPTNKPNAPDIGHY